MPACPQSNFRRAICLMQKGARRLCGTEVSGESVLRPMNKTSWMLVTLAFVCTGTSIAAAPPAKPQTIRCAIGGIGGEPLVPTAQAAAEIFKVVANAISPDLMKKYPDVTVDEVGDHWVVGQINKSSDDASRRSTSGIILTRSSNGQLKLDIDKCDGAINNASLNR